MPVVQEELSVERWEVTTGTVRIRKIVHQEEQLIDEPLKATQIDVERIAVNPIVDGPIPVRHERDTAIYSVFEEVVVVTKPESQQVLDHTAELMREEAALRLRMQATRTVLVTPHITNSDPMQ